MAIAPAQSQLAPRTAARPAEDFATLPLLENPKLSPDGASIAAKVAVRGKQYFAILPVGGGQPRLVQTSADLNWWRWVNKDWLVVGIGGKVPVMGYDIYVRRALGVSTAGKVIQLSDRRSAQGADNVIWVARDGTPRILLAFQKSIFGGDLDFWTTVAEVDVSTGKSRHVAGPREGVLSWSADSGGTLRMGVGTSLDGRTARVLYRDTAGQPFREIVRAARPQDLVLPDLFLADPAKALALAEDEAGFTGVHEYDLKALKLGKRLHGSPGFDIAGFSPDRKGDAIAGVYFSDDSSRTLWLDPDLAKMHDEVAGRVKGAAAGIASYSDDHQRALVRIGAPDSPGAYYLYDRKSGEMAQLAHLNPAIKMARLHPVKTIRYTARDGTEIAAVLTLPKAGGADLPLIVLPHGGPFARDDESWDGWTQFLADRGYAVVQPNYRGSSGYGAAFARKGRGRWGLAMQDDLNDAVTHLAAAGVADPKRVCMAGASYGGYAAFRAAQRDGKLYRCAISYAGVSDLRDMVRYDRNFLASGARTDWLRVQAPNLEAVSPINHAGQFATPLLVLHGKADEVVPVAQSRDLVEKLRRAGKPVTYIEQPEGDHHFTRAEDRLQFLNAMEAFLTEHNPA